MELLKNVGLMLLGCFIPLFVVYLLVAIPAVVFFKTLDSHTFFLGIGLFIFVPLFLLLGVLVYWLWKNKDETGVDPSRLWDWLWESFAYLPELGLVLLVGLGIPAWVIYFFGGGRELLDRGEVANPVFLARGLQLGFIAIACVIPALMYFMFARQDRVTLSETFIREVMMLDPNVRTTVDAKTKYGPLFDNVYGSGTLLDPIPIYISTALITLGWILTLLPIGRDLAIDSGNLINLFTPNAAPLNYGFLGAYFFTINMVFRRYVRADLTPKTYTYVSIRILFTAILVWAISSLPGGIGGERISNSPYVLALVFFIGIFPDTGLALIQDVLKTVFGAITNSSEEKHPLTELEGVNLYDRTRLLEEGIENIENLVHHNLIELLARTRIPTGRLVDLFDQALLYLHLGPDCLSLRDQLREYGIRTATDLEQVLHAETLQQVLKDKFKDQVGQLNAIECALRDDEWIAFLRQWRNSTSLVQNPATTPEEFYTSAPQSALSREPMGSVSVPAIAVAH